MPEPVPCGKRRQEVGTGMKLKIMENKPKKIMVNSAREKISIRVSKQLLNEIDDFVETSDTYSCRSDFIRDVIQKNKSPIITLNETGLLLHSKTFREIIKQLKETKK